jgi:L-lactate dehydrogenase complex protein LldG
MIESFVAQLRENSCVVHRIHEIADAAALVVERARDLDVRSVAVATADTAVVDGGVVEALRAAGVEVVEPVDSAWTERLPHVDAGVTGARVAVGRPATIGLVARAGAPRGVSLVPPSHFCVLETRLVVQTLDEALAEIARHGLPSAVTWIGGPSRTGDLEMIQTLGVHGPRRVEVVLVGDG